jgi:RecQ-mediated genome instability protein 1
MSSLLQGLITSVKSFQYRRRTEYELYVYIDDGSYISMALVDHSVSTSVSIINYREKISAALLQINGFATPHSFQSRVHFLYHSFSKPT